MSISRNKSHDLPFSNDEQRKAAVENELEISLLDLPPELLQHITNLIPSTVPDDSPKLSETENKPFLHPKSQSKVALSKACFTLYNIFQPQINKEADANKLLKFVLQGNEAEVLKTAIEDPSLFFIKTTARDYAMDLDGNKRTIEDWSPYQAMFGTGDKDMLAVVKPYLDKYLATLTNGKALAIEQEEEKFPDGFDFPPTTYVFTALVTAIDHDQQLIETGEPNKTTLDVLAEFRNYFKPGTVKVGHHFNMNELIKAHEVYDQNWNPWSVRQLDFFGVKVIGFLERLITAPYLQVACQGLNKLIDIPKPEPLKRSFEVKNYVTNNIISVVPLDSDPKCRLCVDFAG